MPSFHELRELLLLSYDDGTIDDEEFLLLYEEFKPKNPDFSYEEYDRFSFRFKKHDLPLLAEVLQIPESFTCYQRSISSGMEALCILLRARSCCSDHSILAYGTTKAKQSRIRFKIRSKLSWKRAFCIAVQSLVEKKEKTKYIPDIAASKFLVSVSSF